MVSTLQAIINNFSLIFFYLIVTFFVRTPEPEKWHSRKVLQLMGNPSTQTPGPETSPRLKVSPTPGPPSDLFLPDSGTRDVAPAEGLADPWSHLRPFSPRLRDQRLRPGGRFRRSLVPPPTFPSQTPRPKTSPTRKVSLNMAPTL